MRVDKMVKATVDALEDIKGHDIVVLDVRRMTALFDKLIIASGDSTRQNKALANHVQEKLKALGAAVYGVEGGQRRMDTGRSGRRRRSYHAACNPAVLQSRGIMGQGGRVTASARRRRGSIVTFPGR